jgi:hypothetical protein
MLWLRWRLTAQCRSCTDARQRILPIAALKEDGTRSTMYLDDYLPAIEQVVFRKLYMPTKSLWLVANWIAIRKFGREWTEPAPILLELESQLTQVLVRDGVTSA